MPKEPNYIIVTPEWSAVLPSLLLLVEKGTPEGKDFARAELQRMARAATYWQNEHGRRTRLEPNPQIMLHEARSIRNG